MPAMMKHVSCPEEMHKNCDRSKQILIELWPFAEYSKGFAKCANHVLSMERAELTMASVGKRLLPLRTKPKSRGWADKCTQNFGGTVEE
jgi:hypothetical protein